MCEGPKTHDRLSTGRQMGELWDAVSGRGGVSVTYTIIHLRSHPSYIFLITKPTDLHQSPLPGYMHASNGGPKNRRM